MAKTILRAYNDANEVFDLDLFNEEPFLLDISTIESGDIGKVFGISSQTFSLPSTNNNDRYFGNLYDLGAQSPISFIKTLPCQVLSDGIEIFNGTIYLDSIITDDNGDTLYNVNVVNEIVDFKYQIQDKTFGSLDWTDYNHTLTYGNITSSWDLGLFNGDVVYPLVEYGVEENDVDAVSLINGGGSNTFTNEDSPLKPIDFKPAIRLSTIVNKIFDSVNYTYSSSFLDSAYMDSVYVLATQDLSRSAGAFVSPVSQSFKAYNDSPQTFSPPSSFFSKLEFDLEQYDNSNRWDTTTSTFRASTSGNYSFAVGLKFQIQNLNTFINRSVQLRLYKNGSPLAGTTRFYNYNTIGTLPPISQMNGNISDNWVNIPLNAGDDIEIYLSFVSGWASEILEIQPTLANNFFQCYQAPLSYQGSNVNLGAVFNPNEKLTDFISGIIQKFNLVFEPNQQNPSIIEIEPFNTWRDNGEVVDWTDKVDRNVKWEIKHPLQNIPRDLYFSDIDDKDYFNTFSKNILDKTFGDYKYFSESDLASGQRRIGSYFAPTPMRYIDGTNDFIVPQIYASKDVGDVKQRMVFKPRLLHYLGKSEAVSLFNLLGLFPGNANQAQQTWWLDDGTETPQPQTEYPVFHHVNALPATSQSLDLHFGNLNHTDYHQKYVNARTPQDAFYTYWSEYVNELYDIESRLLTLNIILQPFEVKTIKLNNKIFIDGHYYRINKISGANLTDESSVKVELLKVIQQKLKYPRRRISIGDIGSGYTDVRISNLGDGGRVEYVDFESGEIITSGSILEQASSRDGYAYYSGSNEVVWTPIRTPYPTTNKSNGVNYIDDRASNVQVNGSGNTIGAYISNANIVGENNTLLESAGNVNIFGNNVYASGSIENMFVVNQSGSVLVESGSSNVIAFNPTQPITEADNGRTIIGNGYIQGTIYSTYENIPLASTDIVYLTSSNANHYHFQWSGGAGVATAYIPSASLAPNDGLTLRFTTDSTLAGTINILPSDGTIDSNPERAMVSTYDSFTAQVINNNYIVISTK